VTSLSRSLDVTVVPRGAVRFPLTLGQPPGFDATRPETWPQVAGRLEYVGGRLEFMPPCGEIQQRVTVDVATELNLWRRAHPEFVVGSNEAGMLLEGEVRGADVAIWRGTSPAQPGFARVPPVLAIEVVGADDDLDMLFAKADWYLGHGIAIVWVVDASSRTVHVVTRDARVAVQDRIAESPLLPGLSPVVADFFRQV
jgi:Uma2 family endonuclease